MSMPSRIHRRRCLVTTAGDRDPTCRWSPRWTTTDPRPLNVPAAIFAFLGTLPLKCFHVERLRRGRTGPSPGRSGWQRRAQRRRCLPSTGAAGAGLWAGFSAGPTGRSGLLGELFSSGPSGPHTSAHTVHTARPSPSTFKPLEPDQPWASSSSSSSWREILRLQRGLHLLLFLLALTSTPQAPKRPASPPLPPRPDEHTPGSKEACISSSSSSP